MKKHPKHRATPTEQTRRAEDAADFLRDTQILIEAIRPGRRRSA